MSFGQSLSKLFGFPWVERIEATHLAPGDLLMVHIAPGITPEEMGRIREQLLAAVPLDVRCVVMSGDTRIDVIRHIDPGTRPLASGPDAT